MSIGRCQVDYMPTWRDALIKPAAPLRAFMLMGALF
jgi:hypothetical protein